VSSTYHDTEIIPFYKNQKLITYKANIKNESIYKDLIITVIPSDIDSLYNVGDNKITLEAYDQVSLSVNNSKSLGINENVIQNAKIEYLLKYLKFDDVSKYYFNNISNINSYYEDDIKITQLYNLIHYSNPLENPKPIIGIQGKLISTNDIWKSSIISTDNRLLLLHNNSGDSFDYLLQNSWTSSAKTENVVSYYGDGHNTYPLVKSDIADNMMIDNVVLMHRIFDVYYKNFNFVNSNGIYGNCVPYTEDENSIKSTSLDNTDDSSKRYSIIKYNSNKSKDELLRDLIILATHGYITFPISSRFIKEFYYNELVERTITEIPSILNNILIEYTPSQSKFIQKNYTEYNIQNVNNLIGKVVLNDSIIINESNRTAELLDKEINFIGKLIKNTKVSINDLFIPKEELNINWNQSGYINNRSYKECAPIY
jgi:hypothetical protein